MEPPDLSIFRPSALERYRQRREERILPRVLATPVFLSGWLLLALLLLGECLIWTIGVPMSIACIGTTWVEETSSISYQHRTAPIVLFVPASEARTIRNGDTAHVQIENGPSIDGKTVSVAPTPLDPSEVERIYSFSDSKLDQPVTVIGIQPSDNIAIHANERVQGQIQSGTRNILSLLFQPEQ